MSLNRWARHRDYAPRLDYFHPLARPWIWYFPDWRRLFAEPAGDCSWSPAGSADSSSLPGGQSSRAGHWHFVHRHPRGPIRAQGWLQWRLSSSSSFLTVVDNEQSFKRPQAALFPADCSLRRDKKGPPACSKRPKSREETPKEGSGNARRYRAAINTRQRTNDKGRRRAGRPNLEQFVFRHPCTMGFEGMPRERSNNISHSTRVDACALVLVAPVARNPQRR